MSSPVACALTAKLERSFVGPSSLAIHGKARGICTVTATLNGTALSVTKDFQTGAP